MHWNPIETAPKDKEDILVYDGKNYSIAYWHPGSEYNGLRGAWRDDEAREIEATHWMPLPAPPPRYKVSHVEGSIESGAVRVYVDSEEPAKPQISERLRKESQSFLAALSKSYEAKLHDIAKFKERYLEAWIAETGLQPTECILVEDRRDPLLIKIWTERKPAGEGMMEKLQALRISHDKATPEPWFATIAPDMSFDKADQEDQESRDTWTVGPKSDDANWNTDANIGGYGMKPEDAALVAVMRNNWKLMLDAIAGADLLLMQIEPVCKILRDTGYKSTAIGLDKIALIYKWNRMVLEDAP